MMKTGMNITVLAGLAALLVIAGPVGAQNSQPIVETVAEQTGTSTEPGSSAGESDALQQDMQPDSANGSTPGCPYDEEAIGQPLLG